MTAYDYVAFGAMAVVFVAFIWLVLFLGDLPANIAKERNHPQVSAIRAMSWFGLLFTGGIVWIFAIVWAYFDSSAIRKSTSTADLEAEIESLRERMATLESKLAQTGDES